MKAACLLPLIAPLLGGCISNTPVDLALASVQAVDWRDQDEMPGPGASPILGMVRNRDLALMGHSITGGPKRPRLLLKIEFTSAVNLSKFVIDNSYNLGVRAYFCDRPGKGDRPGHGFIGLSFPDLYWRGMRLGQHEPDPIERRRGAATQPITYYFYTDVANDETRWVNERDEGFDLLRKPQDICFTVGGGNNSGFGYRSNTVTIPKDVIAAALRNPSGEMAVIYYIPIGIETFTPVTPQDMEERYHRYGKADVKRSDFKKLISEIKAAPVGPFDGQRTRAKISLPDSQIIFVDNDGGIARSTGTYQLTSSQLGIIAKLLAALTDERSRKK